MNLFKFEIGNYGFVLQLIVKHIYKIFRLFTNLTEFGAQPNNTHSHPIYFHLSHKFQITR